MEKITRGLRNNNPFNIKISNNSWLGKVKISENTDGVFEQFREMDYGFRAGIQLLRGYIKRGFDTPESIINRFAPGSENNTKSYLNSVCLVCDFTSDLKIRFNTVEFYSLCAAICWYESSVIFTTFKYHDVCCRFHLCKPYNYLIY